MKADFDEILATAVKRQHGPQRIAGDLLSAGINEKQARSILPAHYPQVAVC
ncbi:SOS response regulatory protein OraA/RecX [Bradyrhizobium sp. F1.13.1]